MNASNSDAKNIPNVNSHDQIPRTKGEEIYKKVYPALEDARTGTKHIRFSPIDFTDSYLLPSTALATRIAY